MEGELNSSLQETDNAAAAIAVAPRVTLADLEAKIDAQVTFIAGKVLKDVPVSDSLNILTICIVTMQNGFSVIGKSAPASPENFNEELGAKFAYEDAVRQLWPLEGYLLRDKQA